MKVKPMRNFLLLRELKEDEAVTKTDSGIFIPDSAKEPEAPRRDAIVVLTGPDVENKNIKEGTHVYLTSMMMKEVIMDGKEAVGFLAKESDILAILEK
jgi:co-chaperonin GroES (HSP10)